MEDFSSELQKVLVPGSSFSELNSNIELLNQPLCSNVLDYFPSDAFVANPNISQQVQSTVQVPQPSYFCTFDQANDADFRIQRHGKNVAQTTEFSEVNTSPGHGSEPDGDYWTNKVNGNGERKRKRGIQGKGDKQKEVVHVRAKRGQATDSHSLAERVRRERINEKLKVLQDLVPGCYKTMAMAAMLDVIIHYVRSLQNQIEFLSMKLSAASLYYDFNSPEAEAIETILKTTIPYEAHETTETSTRGEFKGTVPRLYSTWPF